MPTLYELQGSYAQIQQMIVDGAGGLEETLESIEGAIEEKLEAYVMVIRNLEADVIAYDTEEKRFKERKAIAKKGINRMKQAIEETMKLSNRDEVKTEKFNIKFRNNAPSVHILDESLIPKEFIKIERTISKAELAKRLKESEIPGVKLVVNKSLQIK
ncbi:siphovirus Gp157 family protein [Psychrobacillus sp. Sa2BUA9]|uniref:Siphovirus Gp157 family protein n=1 Tax=Psychrobacillus faecigallinarum TaxID=2762235 RepID=A0ABR8R3Z1_9BACI|nr:siphovirus Gp157 family protein [Psychrobacillus faecigallinarum]MBD7942510.1 siphovirus Gp157 family protein [Psychrobacillus faecigallinarum]